jgi:hypothetical protein
MRKTSHNSILVDPRRMYVSLPLHPGGDRTDQDAEASAFMHLLTKDCLVTAARLEYPAPPKACDEDPTRTTG